MRSGRSRVFRRKRVREIGVDNEPSGASLNDKSRLTKPIKRYAHARRSRGEPARKRSLESPFQHVQTRRHPTPSYLSSGSRVAGFLLHKDRPRNNALPRHRTGSIPESAEGKERWFMNCYKRVPLPAWDFSYARVAPRSAVVGSMGEDAAGNTRRTSDSKLSRYRVR